MATIPFSEIGENRQVALVRMLLAFTGFTHEHLSSFNDTAASILRRHYQTAADSPKVLSLLNQEWGKSYATWLEAFENARYQAAALAFGELALMHGHFMGLVFPIEESRPDFPPVFEPQLEEVARAAEERIHGDGFKLSQRIWRHDRESWEGIKRTVQAGIADQKSAWALAQDVEQYLGIYADCPRWTSTRLFRLTKRDIAQGDRTGLLSGSDCSPERGVAYNALRLARTEITYASNTATKSIHDRSPWVEAVKINLSPQHPEPDICDDYANGGNGRGVYPKGEVLYPPYHPHCLCFVTAETMSDDAFVKRMRGFLNNPTSWPAMERYSDRVGANFLRTGVPTLLAGMEDTLFKWVFDLPEGTQPYLPGMQRFFESASVKEHIDNGIRV